MSERTDAADDWIDRLDISNEHEANRMRTSFLMGWDAALEGDKYVVVTRYAPEGKRPLVHTYGYYGSRNSATVAMRKFKRDQKKYTPEAMDDLEFRVCKILVESEEPEDATEWLDAGTTEGITVIEVNPETVPELAPATPWNGIEIPSAAEVSPEVFDIVSGNSQHRQDMETVREHLARGAFPQSGERMWGGLEWAVARLTAMEWVADTPMPEGAETGAQSPHEVIVHESPERRIAVGFRYKWQARLFELGWGGHSRSVEG